MGKVVIELNSEGVQELLKSPIIAAACEAEAKKMTQMTGMKYVADVYIGTRRVNARGVAKKAMPGVAFSNSSPKKKEDGNK